MNQFTPSRTMYCVEDVELANKVAEGNREAMATLVDRYYAPLFRYLWHASGCREDAEDLASQALIRARTDIRGYRSQGSLQAWIFRVAHRELLRHRRRQTLSALFSSRTIPEEIADFRDDFIVLTAALARIPVSQRTAFLLTEIEGLTADEAAQSLNVPPGTIKSRCFHAKKRLREILGPTYPEVSNHAKPIPD